jgi:hypothetical protein
MTTGTMHMGGFATGAARVGDACSTLPAYSGLVAPIALIGHKPWHATNAKQVSAVFTTDRPSRQLSERFP